MQSYFKTILNYLYNHRLWLAEDADEIILQTSCVGSVQGQFSSVQLLSRVQVFAIPWIRVRQASLSITDSQSLLKLMSIMPVIPSNHLILCHPPLLLPSIFPSIWVFPNESVFHIRKSKYWSFSFSISPSNEYSGLISFRMDWLNLLVVSQESSPKLLFKSVNSLALPFFFFFS